MNKYQVDLSTQGQWKCSLRFHAADDDRARERLLELSEERPGRQFQLICLTTNKHMGYAVAPMPQARKEERREVG